MAAPVFPSTLAWTPPLAPSRKLQVFLTYIECRNRLDTDTVMHLFHSSLEHRYLPKSLGRPVLNKEQYREYLEQLCPMFTTYTITPHDVIESEDSIVFHATSKGVSTLGVVYMNEYMTTLRFTTGEWETPQIVFMKEYVDSAKILEFFKEHRARMAAQLEKGRAPPRSTR